MHKTLAIIALCLSAGAAQAKTVNVYWKLIQPSTLRLVKITSSASAYDIVNTYLYNGSGYSLWQKHNNGLHQPDKFSTTPMGQIEWLSCTGCNSGDGGGGNKLYGAVTTYDGGVSTYEYQIDGSSVAPMGATGEDQGTYTVVTTDINNDGVVVIQKYGITIPFGHIVISFQKVGTYGQWAPAGRSSTISSGVTATSGTNILVPEDEDLENKGH